MTEGAFDMTGGGSKCRKAAPPRSLSAGMAGRWLPYRPEICREYMLYNRLNILKKHTEVGVRLLYVFMILHIGIFNSILEII